MDLIETERLVLRQYTKEDIEDLHKILSDPITMAFWPAPFSMEDTRSWVTRQLESYETTGFGRWAVILKETKALVGDCGIIVAEIDGQHENDLGYIIHQDYWRRGFAVEAAGACKDYAFEKLGMKRLCANMAWDHGVSAKVAERIGMKKEKEFLNNRNRNILTYVYVAEAGE